MVTAQRSQMVDPRADAPIGRAAAMVPTLRERASLAEAERRIPQETVDEIVASGLLRLAHPDRFGGCGLDFDALFEIEAQLGRGCGSTAWCYAVWASHNWWLGLFPEQAQAEYFSDRDVLSSSSLIPAGRATPIDGGYRLSGRWDFASGCDVARWVTVGALVDGGMHWFLVPRPDYRIIDTWFVSGLRGTGSKDVLIEDVFVPDHRVLDQRVADVGKTEAWAQHQRPGYRAPLFSLLPWTLTAPQIGMAQGAVEEFAEQLQRRTIPGGGSAAQSVAAQLRLAEAAAEVDAARALMRQDYREVLDGAARGDEVSLADRARYRRDQTFAAQLCVRAVQRLFDGAGGHALYDANPLQRFHRDVNAASHHLAMRWDEPAETYARLTLGLEPATGARF
jgi:alkylation response protein AidB-like acyl-CoA dehydrogenase